MSPLRRWFTGHGLPGWYSWVVVVGLTLVSNALVILISLRSAQRAVEAERAARVTAAEDGRRTSCVMIGAQLAAYAESPPQTPAGRNILSAWQDMNTRFRCEEK